MAIGRGVWEDKLGACSGRQCNFQWRDSECSFLWRRIGLNGGVRNVEWHGIVGNRFARLRGRLRESQQHVINSICRGRFKL